MLALGWLRVDLNKITATLVRIDSKLEQIDAKLDRILASPVPVRFIVTVIVLDSQHNQRRNVMSDVQNATVDLQVLDSGKVKYVFNPVDAAGNPAALPAGTPALSFTSSDPALTVEPDPSDSTGLTAIGTPSGKLATGVVVTGQTTLPGSSTPIGGTAAPVDIVAGGPSGFQVQETAQ